MRPPGAVRVTAGHTATGRRSDPHGCAIAPPSSAPAPKPAASTSAAPRSW